ncbi:acyl-CoA-binding domain-containing protein 3-like isoform X1 [Bidens hawaiensis]|uniref:acyl-CoA-binding domain-containing protein 3-like isoform X1 n=2 Tax=Bidens hawaiensis TaxID=980011 RepID=UPI00404AFFDF
MEIFMTVILAFVFLLIIAKINGSPDHPQPVTSISKTKTKTKTKSTKKVRVADDHDELVVNKTVAGPSETKSIVFDTNRTKIEEDCGDESEKKNCMKLLCDDGIDEAEKEKEGLISDEDDSLCGDDDWEGVERSDLEKVFAMAAEYAKSDNNNNLESLDNDVQMQLYALHKVATEGPCREAQPMALKVSARAKWNAWQKLGNMNPDVAMELYIALLTELVPGWSQGIHSVDKN